MIQLVIVDDHSMVREGLRMLIENEADIRIVGEAGNGKEAVSLLKQTPVDVVVLDIALPDKNGIEVLKDLKHVSETVRVLMLSMHAEDRFGVRSIQAGASGYITKGSASEELVNAIRTVHRGGKYIPARLAEILVDEIGYGRELRQHERLSDREFEIMLMMGRGNSRAKIAETLNISAATVSTYRRRILAKLNIGSNADLLRYVMENNLLD